MLKSGYGLSHYDIYTSFNSCRETLYWGYNSICIEKCIGVNSGYRGDSCQDLSNISNTELTAKITFL